LATYRQIHTSFWQDGFVLGLTPEEKYFYIYLMTNSKTTQCGIYELPKRVIEMETGYNRETVDKLLDRFIKFGRIQYEEIHSEIMLMNWHKYNFLKSPKVISKIKQELLNVKTARFRERVLAILEESGLADKTLYRMANKTEIPRSLAAEVFERDKRCVRCNSETDLTIDHIFPRNIGGTNVKDNLRVLCRSCNSKRPTIGKALEDDLKLDGLTLDDFERICMSKPYHENPIPYQETAIPYQQKEEEKEKEKEKEIKDNIYAPPFNDPIKNHLHRLCEKCKLKGYNIVSADDLFEYIDKMEIEVIESAIKKAYDKHFNYAINTLEGWLKEGKTKVIYLKPKRRDDIARPRTSVAGDDFDYNSLSL